MKEATWCLVLSEHLCKDCLQSEMRNNAMFFCTDWCYSSVANKATPCPVSHIPAKEGIPSSGVEGLVPLCSQPPGSCTPLPARSGVKLPQSPSDGYLRKAWSLLQSFILPFGNYEFLFKFCHFRIKMGMKLGCQWNRRKEIQLWIIQCVMANAVRKIRCMSLVT